MEQPSLVRPPRLRPGDLVAIVNPSRALPGGDPSSLLAGSVRGLEALGLRVRLMPHLGAMWTPLEQAGRSDAALGGTDEERAADINAALADPAVRMVLAAYGGGGADRLLRPGLIEWDRLAAEPKILLGFSDFSHLALTAHQRLRMVTFDGPTAFQWAAPADEPMLVQARAVLLESRPAGALAPAATWYASQVPPGGAGGPPARARPGGWRWARPGRATGRLVAAMPGIYRTLLDLGLAPSLAGAIWCLDPYRTPPAEIGRLLADLRARGTLDGLAGLVVARPWPSAAGEADPLDEAVLAATRPLQPTPPVLLDADVGHTWPRWTLPNGVQATLDSDADRFSIDEAAVS